MSIVLALVNSVSLLVIVTVGVDVTKTKIANVATLTLTNNKQVIANKTASTVKPPTNVKLTKPVIAKIAHGTIETNNTKTLKNGTVNEAKGSKIAQPVKHNVDKTTNIYNKSTTKNDTITKAEKSVVEFKSKSKKVEKKIRDERPVLSATVMKLIDEMPETILKEFNLEQEEIDEIQQIVYETLRETTKETTDVMKKVVDGIPVPPEDVDDGMADAEIGKLLKDIRNSNVDFVTDEMAWHMLCKIRKNIMLMKKKMLPILIKHRERMGSA